jgi:hypothetical protein
MLPALMTVSLKIPRGLPAKCCRRMTLVGRKGHCQRKVDVRALSEENRVAAGEDGATVATMSDARIFRYFKTSPEIIRLAVMLN